MTNHTIQLYLIDEAATLALGSRLAAICPDQPFTIHLTGELGAGKTTLCRGLLQELGHEGKVKSPTYTLVEYYQLTHRAVAHVDLYRLSSPEELHYIGVDEYMGLNSLFLIEWPQQGGDYLADPDIIIALNYQGSGRYANICAVSATGKSVCSRLHE